MMRVRTRAFLHFGETLAASPEPIVRPLDMARLEGIPVSTAHEWVQQMRFQRALVPREEGYRVDRPRLLAFYTAHRVVRLTPRIEVTTSLDPQEMAARFAEQRIHYAFGMFTAANIWAFYEARRSEQLYLSRRNARHISDLLPPGDIRLEVFAENLPDHPIPLPESELPIVHRGGANVTGAFLTILDCRAHPEGGAHATFLERVILDRGRHT